MTKDSTLFFRVTDDEKNALERAARKEGLTISAFVRRALMIEKYVAWDATAMREIRRQIEDQVDAWEKANAPREEKRKRA